MTKDNLIELEHRDISRDAITKLVRNGAQQILAKALEIEVTDFLARCDGQYADDGLRAVVRSGCHPKRAIQTGVGPVSVQIPKVRSNTGEPVSLRLALIPPYVRKTGTH